MQIPLPAPRNLHIDREESVMELHVFSEAQEGATYDDQLRVAQAAESLGFAGFFRSDHYLEIMGGGVPGPTDAWVTLAGLARETHRIRLGTLVSPATFRLPGPLAVMVAQVDAMSGGRVELGLGAGWYPREHRAYGIPFPDLAARFDRLVEYVEIIDGLWRTTVGERFSYQGAHYQLTDSPALPKPVQSPRPPIIFGGLGRRRSAQLVARFGDEFNVAWRPLAETAGIFTRLRANLAGTARDPASPAYSAGQVICVGKDESEVRRRADVLGQDAGSLRTAGLTGTPAEVVDKIGQLAELGVSRIYLQFLDLTDIAQLELIAAEVLPQL
jgi:alkanesulfonate monooxygenase